MNGRSRLDPLRERLLAKELSWVRTALPEDDSEALIAAAEQALAEVTRYRMRFQDLVDELAHRDASGQRASIERYLRETSSDSAQLARDLALLDRRAPGVLDRGALEERLARLADGLECRAEVCLALISVRRARPDSVAAERIGRMALMPGRWSRRTEAIGWFRTLGVDLPEQSRTHARELLLLLARPHEHRWVQPAAIAALAAVDNRAAHDEAGKRLARPSDEADDFIVRASIVGLFGQRKRTRWLDLLPRAHRDPSELVRMTAASVEPDRATLARIAAEDPCHRVRAASLLRIARRHRVAAEDVLSEALTSEPHSFVVETVAGALLAQARRGQARTTLRATSALAQAAVRDDLSPSARCACVDAGAELRVRQGTERAALDQVLRLAREIPVGSARQVTSGSLIALGSDRLAEVLAVAARDDFGLGADRNSNGLLLHRGERLRPSFWRVLFELSHPSAGKRPGGFHLSVRRLPGEVRAPSALLAEATATRVPDERLLIVEAGEWGRDVPRVEDLLTAGVVRKRVLRIGSARGVTTIEPPRSLVGRLRAWWALTLHHDRLASARRRAILFGDSEGRVGYGGAVSTSTGISVHFSRHATSAETTEAAPFSVSTLGLAPLAFSEQVESLRAWAGETRLSHLAGYALLVVGALVARQMAARHRIEAHRERIPLVIGGWGTRGKSGTERLKAALFHGLGYECLVKTTGCEAMFIHAIPGVAAHEIFIERPYDKATVWEQGKVLSLADRLGVRVLLWECMALQPELVDLLQNQWMHDDVSTITNAYPDHEDVQGPTGYDVATTIAEFVPSHSMVLTTEAQMLPILRERARSRHSRLHEVTRCDAGLISADLLARFPHAEHPSNIALVAALARKLGIPPLLAITEMADHLVADLGALKTYPTVTWQGRRLTFTNGMGANDRAGTLENWRRTGFGDAPAGGYIVTVVNNRADRPARSEVFADLLVNDISADRHVLIGTNLGGLQGSIRHALELRVRRLAPTRDLGGGRGNCNRDEVIGRITQAFASIRVSGTDAKHVAAEAAALGLAALDDALLETLLNASAQESYELATQSVDRALRPRVDAESLRSWLQILVPRRVLRGVITHAFERFESDPAAVDEVFATAYRAVFLRSLVVIDDARASGDLVIDAVARSVPRGADVKIMGLQNIKGTGLDFAYRWVSIEKITILLTRLERAAPSARGPALDALKRHRDYGLLDASLARDVLARCATSDSAHAVQYDQLLKDIAAFLENRAQSSDSSMRRGVRRFIGETLDFADAINRRRRSMEVVDLLVAGQISHGTAAERMRAIVARSKGGWMR